MSCGSAWTGFEAAAPAAGESLDDLLPECFAIVREAGRPAHGDAPFRRAADRRHGAARRGSIAEMRTGEGKTLTATLAVVLNTLAGNGVAPRHRQRLPGAARCGVDEPDLPRHSASPWECFQSQQEGGVKIDAYACDVTYGTNAEFGFDYLRDNMAGSLEDKVPERRAPRDGRPAA